MQAVTQGASYPGKYQCRIRFIVFLLERFTASHPAFQLALKAFFYFDHVKERRRKQAYQRRFTSC